MTETPGPPPEAILRISGVLSESWPAALPLPHVGETVALSDGTRYLVTEVVWWPYGETADPAPFVIIVAARPPQTLTTPED